MVSTDYSPPMLDENTEPKLGPDPKEIAAARRSMSELAFAEAGMDRKKLKKAVTARSTDAPVKRFGGLGLVSTRHGHGASGSIQPARYPLGLTGRFLC